MEQDQEVGRVEWIGLRPGRREPIQIVQQALLTPGGGLAGDHFRPRRGSSREVTLIRCEHLAEIGQLLGREPVSPALLRRNLVISHVDLPSLIGRQFHVGTALLEGTGPCSPCSRMDEALGDGARKAMSGRGGITARILVAGEIHLGDSVEPADEGRKTTSRG